MIKFGMVTVGVAAGLLAAAPLASAHEAEGGSGNRDGSADCVFTGGTGGDAGSGDASGELALTGGNAGGFGGSNVLNIADCSDFLNHNGNGNQIGSNNEVLGSETPALPEAPELPGADDLGGAPSLPDTGGVAAPGVSAPGA